MTQWINQLVESYGLGLLFVVIALESAGLPLPADAIAHYGLIGAAVAVAAAVLAFLAVHAWKRRLLRAEEGA